jgi:hypothetical protein
MILIKLDKTRDDKENHKKTQRDDLIDDYDSVLRESALLTTVAGILFGFLLNISVNPQIILPVSVKI